MLLDAAREHLLRPPQRQRGPAATGRSGAGRDPLRAMSSRVPGRRGPRGLDVIERLMAWTRLDRLLPRGAILLAVLTFGGYAMGLVRDRIFARTFGAGTELDAYNAAFVLPELALDVLVAGGLTAPFVPIFLGLRDGADGGESSRARVRPDDPDPGGHRHGIGLGRPVRPGAVHGQCDRPRLRVDGRSRPVHRAVPGDVRDPGDLRRLDHPGRGPGGRSALPLLRARSAPVQRRDRGRNAPPGGFARDLRRGRRCGPRGAAPPRHPRRRDRANPVPASEPVSPSGRRPFASSSG